MPPFEYDPKELFEAIARLADERDQSWRFTRKGDKRPAYDVEAQKAARQRNLKAKRDAAAERILAATRLKTAPPAPGQDIASRMLRAMEPGQWYGMGDLMRMIGADRTARGKVHQVLMKRGWVEKAHNPAYSGVKLNPWEIMAGGEPQPQRLYRLTETGLAKRRELAEKLKGG